MYTNKRQVEHQPCSRTGRVQKNHNFKEKTQYLMNTLYIKNRLYFLGKRDEEDDVISTGGKFQESADKTLKIRILCRMCTPQITIPSSSSSSVSFFISFLDS